MKKTFIIAMLLSLPLFSLAAVTDLTSFLDQSSGWSQKIGNLLIAAATLVFFWGIVQFIWQDKKEEGKMKIIWGILALFVMFSIWGIIRFMQTSTFGSETTIAPPNIP